MVLRPYLSCSGKGLAFVHTVRYCEVEYKGGWLINLVEEISRELDSQAVIFSALHRSEVSVESKTEPQDINS